MESQLINPIISTSNSHNLSPRQSTRSVQPKRQQWAMIYNQQAEQFKRQKQAQKLINRQKREQFRYDLDQQLYSRTNLSQHQKQQDKKFSEYIKTKVNQQNQRQKNQKLKRLLQRRRIQQQNFNRIETVKKSSRVFEDSSITGLFIDDKPAVERKKQNHSKQKSLSDALDRQLQIKQEERKAQKQSEQHKNQANQQYMNNYYQRRQTIQPRRKQNLDIYNYFQKLNQQKLMKDKQLEKKLVDQVIIQKRLQQIKKQEIIKKQKELYERQTRSILEQQMKYKSQQNLNQKKYNPQQNSYQIIGGIFRDRKYNYDKKQYFQFLARQAEQQSKRKKNWDYMNQEQYRLNLNQLNKAVTGKYENDYYIDRTMNMIGQNKARGISAVSLDLNTTRINREEDVIAVKHKLDQIKKHKNGNQNQTQSLSFHP